MRHPDENRPLSSHDAIVLGEKARSLISKEISDLIDSVDANYVQNRQIILRIHAGPSRREDCWKVRTALASALRESPLQVNGRDVYAIVEPTGSETAASARPSPSWRRCSAPLRVLGSSWTSAPGSRTTLQLAPTPTSTTTSVLGRTDAKQGWTWLEKPLTETFADLDTALLTERTADALARYRGARVALRVHSAPSAPFSKPISPYSHGV